MSVPMGQICLHGACNKSAIFMKDGIYYCAEHLDKTTATIINNDLIVNTFNEAIDQLNYLSKRLSAKEFTFTRPTTNETINMINDVVKLIKEGS